MTAETGPLRIVPASHLGYPPTPSADDKALPHPQEQLLDARAGDMIVMHGECIHSGTANTSGHLRAYISTFVTRVGFPHRDDFSSPGAMRLLEDNRGDRRVLRFLGAEDDAALGDEEKAWAELRRAEATERAAL